MGRYQKVNHTADLGILVEADTVEDLFVTFAQAMFENMIEGKLRKETEMRIELSSSDQKELLLDWLRELLYLFEVKGFIPVEYNLSIMKKRLKARLKGDTFNPSRHTAFLEIKIPTYHQFQLERTGEGLKGQIIFDV